MTVIPIRFKRGTKDNLPVSADAGEPLFTEDTHEMFIGTGDGIVPVSDPALKKRVDVLEQSRSTVAQSYTEGFKSRARVDEDRTTATISTGKLKVARTATFTEDFSTTDNFDSANSYGVSVDTVLKKARLNSGVVKGSYISSHIPTAGINRVRVNSQIATQFALGVQSNERITNDAKSYYFPLSLIDRSGREWLVVYIDGEGIYVEIKNPDGSLAFSGKVFTSTAKMTVGYTTHNIALDYNNRVWVTLVDNASSTRSVAIGVINPDGTVYKSMTTIYTAVSINVQHNCVVVDPNGRVWVFITVSSGTCRYWAFEPDGTPYLPMTAFGSTANWAYISVILDTKRKIFLVMYSQGNTLSLLRVGLDGVAIGAIVSINSTGITHGNADSYYDPVEDRLVTFATTANGLYFWKTNIDTPVGTAPIVYSGAVPVTTRGRAGIYYDGVGMTRVVYLHPVTAKLCHIALNSSSFTLAEPETVIVSGLRPFISKNTVGKLQVLFDSTEDTTNTQIRKAIFDMVPTSALVKVSNDRGVSWVDVIDGEEIVFPKEGDYITIRVDFSSPNGSVSSELTRFSFSVGSGNGNLTQEFVSTKLPSVMPIAFATLTAQQALNGGSIEWFITNNGGGDWITANLGEKLTFPNPVNADLRVKAVITSPTGSAGSPIVTEYTVVSSNILLNPEISDPALPQRVVDLEINLLKTNFKLITYMNAAKYGLKNIGVDTFTDLSGIDIPNSPAVYDSVNKCFTTGLVDIVPAMTANNAPAPYVASADATTSGQPWQGFNKAGGTWSTTANGSHWLKIFLGGSEQVIDRYYLSGGKSYAPTSWRLEGSVDNTVWDILHTVPSFGWGGVYTEREFLLDAPSKPYKYYRIFMTNSEYGTGVTAVDELRLVVSVDQNHIQSKPEITTVPPKRIVVVGDEELGSGSIEYQVSRDGGATFYDIPQGVLTDLDSQPIGTSLVVRAIIKGNARLNAWGYYYE